MDEIFTDDTRNANAIWSTPTENSARRPTRPPRDPDLQVTNLNAGSVEEFQSVLRDYLQTPPADPEHSQCEIQVWAGAIVMITMERQPRQEPEKRPMSIAEALVPQSDSKDTMKRQRSVAKAFIDAIQRVDGFRYAFHNNWKSGEDYRFSYYCNDSLLNKDRVANGKHGSAGKRAYKPVYDCKGVMSVKFSAARQCVDVIYKHVPLHETYEVRAPPPRKDAKRRRSWEMNHPDRVRVARFIEPEQAGAVASVPDSNAKRVSPVVKPKEKKKKSTPKSTATAEFNLREQSMRSLLELIRTDNDDTLESTSQRGAPGSANAARTTAGNAQSEVANKPVQKAIPRQRIACAICRSKRNKCDGLRPSCTICRVKEWPCFYLDVGSADNQLLPQLPVEPSTSAASFAQNSTSHTVPANMISASEAALANVSAAPDSQLFDTRTELALLKDKLKEADARIKQLESEKASRQAPTTTARRVPQAGRPHHASEDRSKSNNAYNNSITYTPNPQFATPNQTQTPTQQSFATSGQSTPQQPTFAPNAQAQTSFGAPPNQRQNAYGQAAGQSPATAAYMQNTNQAVAAAAAAQQQQQQQQQNTNTLYGQQMRWPQAQGYGFPNVQTQQQNMYGTRMR